MSVNEKMTAIADAIRDKTGGTDPLTLDGMAAGVEQVYEAGQQAEYDRFWDAYQNYGANRQYARAFGLPRWDDVTFRPKYDIIVEGAATSMFQECGITQLTEMLKEQGVVLDTSKMTSAFYMFAVGAFITIPTVSFENCTDLDHTFAFCYRLTTIDTIVLKSDGSNTFSAPFNNCLQLKEIRVEGCIGKNGLNFQWSPLTRESLLSIISCLVDKSADTSGTEWKVTIGTGNYAKLTEEEIDVAEQKGWVLE